MNKAEIKAEIVKYKRKLESASAPDEVAFANKKIDKLNADLLAAEATPEKKVVTVKKHVAPVKKAVQKPSKVYKTIKVGDKVISENDPNFCDAITKQWKERLAKREKAQGKYKTTSVSSKIGKDAAHAIIKAIDEVSSNKISSNPKVFISLVETSEKKRSEYIDSLERIIKFGGGHLNKAEIKEEMEAVDSLLKKIKEKLKK